jgi:hypothetical protein
MLVIGEHVDTKPVDQIVDDVCRLYGCHPSVEMEPAVATSEI